MRNTAPIRTVLLASALASTGAAEAQRVDVPTATVRSVGSGVFALAEGDAVYVEEKGNRILVAFPKRTTAPRKNAYWPGPPGDRERCTELAVEEFELVMVNKNVCVRLGLSIDVSRDVGVPDLELTGGCSIDIVRVAQSEPPAELILRADCSEIEIFSKIK